MTRTTVGSRRWQCRSGEGASSRPTYRICPGREDLANYCNEVERADRSFGDALQVLRRHGQESNTLIVFMGDNGMAFPHGKGSLYDPGLNVAADCPLARTHSTGQN